MNCVINNRSKSQLDAVLHSNNLACIVKLPTKIGLNSQTAIGNVFVDTSTFTKYDLYPLIHGLSDHDAQLLIINKVEKQEKGCHTDIKKKNKYIIADFQLKLSHETREPVLMGMMGGIFKSFLNIFLRIYNSGFFLIRAKNKMRKFSWITPGIITSCKQKRVL